MMRLTAFLDWLDEAAGGLIRLAYLAAGVTAVAVYFGAGQLPANVDAAFNAALPWALAFALETHTYLTARRVRAAWQDRDRGALRVNCAVLVVLLAFSAWNQLGYLSGVWSPPHTGPLALPLWLAYAVRALIVPAAFMAAAFLAPLAPPIAAQIEGEARATLADVFRIARKQRRKLLKEAQASGRDMTGALVELVSDPDTRRIISHAYAAIKAPAVTPAVTRSEGAGDALSALAAIGAPTPFEPTGGHGAATQEGAGALPSAAPESSIEPDRPPTGPGSPALGSNPRKQIAERASAKVTPLRQGLGRPPRRDKRTAARANARSGRKGTAETRIRAILASQPDVDFDELVKRAKVSRSTASKYVALVEAERQAAQQAQPRQEGAQYAQ